MSEFLKQCQGLQEYRARADVYHLFKCRPVWIFFIFLVGQLARHLPKLAGRFWKVTRNATLKQIRPANSNAALTYLFIFDGKAKI